jgi:hypothetical protein
MEERTDERDDVGRHRQARGRPAGERVECVERLAKILAKEFSLSELKFVQNYQSDAIRIEAFEIARTKAR